MDNNVKLKANSLTSEVRKLIDAETANLVQAITIKENSAHKESVEATFNDLTAKAKAETEKKIKELEKQISDINNSYADLLVKFGEQKQSAFLRKEQEILTRAKALAENKYRAMLTALDSVDNEAEKIN